MNNNTFRLSQAQFGHTLFLLGVAMATTNAQGRSEYVRLCNVLTDNTPRSSGYEIQLTGPQQEQIGTALQTVRSSMTGATGGPSPPEVEGWMNDLEQVWGIRAAQRQGAGSR